MIKKALMRDEGFVPHAYKDSLGYLTIGYGFLIDEKLKAEIPKTVADFWLDYEIRQVTIALTREFAWFDDLDYVRQDVLINMCFNLGITRLKTFKKTIALIGKKQYKEASVEMLNSVWATQVKGRATRLAKEMETGERASA